MAIEGLRKSPQPNEVNISDQVGASVEALDRLGLIEDRDQVTESVAAEFKALNQSGKTGELFIQLPRNIITLEGLVRSLDSGVYPGDKEYPETDVFHKLWTPGTETDGYKADDLDNLKIDQKDTTWVPHARLAVHNPASEQEPLLHFLGQPFDGMYPEDGKQTQLESVAKVTKAYNAEHEGFEMTPLNAKAVAMIALLRRIKGESMPMSWGYMRDATLPRRTVRGVSYVWDVYSNGDLLYLNGSIGCADSDSGVGLSVGPKVLEPQAF